MHELPVLVTCFNRPDLLERILTPLNQSKVPLRVYFHVDGARTGNSSDTFSIDVIRMLIEAFAKKRQVHLHFQKSNLGMRMAMINAIT